MNCPEILQHDYGNQPYEDNSFCGACAMVAASNCVGSSVTMALAIKDGVVDESNGYVNSWSKYATIPRSSTTASLSSALPKICKYINDNDCPLILTVKPSHFVVAYSASGETAGDISVMDPWVGYTTLEEVLTRKTWSGYRYVSAK